MADVPQVTIVDGIPTGGTGTVETNSQVIAAINGTVADGDADSGNSSKVAGVAKGSMAAVTLDSAGDRVPVISGLDRILITRPHCTLEDIRSGVASNTDGTSTEVIATAGAGVKQYLTSISIVNMHATTTVYVEIKSGTTVKWRMPCPPGGALQTFNPPLPPNAADEAWNFDASAAVTTLYYSAIGFRTKV